MFNRQTEGALAPANMSAASVHQRLGVILGLGLMMAALPAMPAFAQSIDTSAWDSFFQSVLNAMTGTTGRLLMTIIAVGLLIAGAMNFMDWGRVLQLFMVIVLIGVIPTVITSIWGAGTGGGTP